MKKQLAIQFVGGPFDGYDLVVSLPPGEELAETAAFPIDRNVFEILHGKSGGKPASVTSVAIYHLMSSPGDVPHQYYFVAALSPDDVQLPRGAMRH